MSTAGFASFAGAVPILVGREREQGVLRDYLAAALAGHGSLALISGEAGIGKTALAETLGREAVAQGARVLVGRCYDLSESPPYGPWVDLFARSPRGGTQPVPPDLISGAGATSQAALVQQVRDYVAALAAHRPLGLLLDDLHWADPASLNLLRIVARDLADLPLLLLVTYRGDELPRHHPLTHHLPLLVHEARAARLDLPPPDAMALEALVRRYAIPPADTARLVTYLRERAEGNPFFAGELLRTMAEQGTLHHDEAGWHLGDLSGVRVSRLLRQVIEGRLERLSAADQQLLSLAAVVGPAVPLTLWMAVGGSRRRRCWRPLSGQQTRG